ncbi:DUF1499 domain-containing protein [Pacificimonas sp. WHA3]|uniref:DUF1499 domain-containing protein n=1 Tax=Pacificimonas pallii TaxID=2827236 RepID=A0ABS6SAI6_9SPHN|nr:DUF1499 domain-containing protein [Pacificimonas pallii]MBV7255387.1 DUF1499 domain-containing protein [Pacificimonas pallii]
MLNDITTDLANPPRFELTGDGPPDFDSATIGEHVSKYGNLEPIILAEDMPAAFRRVRNEVEARRWKLVAADEQRGQLEAIAVTRLLRFKDDIVIRLTAEDTGTRIDLRSKSRVGRDDFGANAKRIGAFLNALKRG